MADLITKTTELAMSVTLAYIRPGDTAVDATCGTGRDTVSLARAVGSEGRVYAFDIQNSALLMTEERLRKHGLENVNLLKQSFTTMCGYAGEESASAVVFNLGYLPGGDHSISTTAETTLEGLECALRTVRPGGVVTVVMYDGHEEGAVEKARVLEWAEGLDQSRYHAAYVSLINQNGQPPEVLWITKKSERKKRR